ncbi:hypothetical protein BKA66DRAFT_583220 [Pyrenochaeta sp. MPI-SDFR-AT-0127]|nr:hypothetical protein BKA66DRAFT_583220 [Pyrenochaeta sp. MPI-SDFR-AT-0127]
MDTAPSDIRFAPQPGSSVDTHTLIGKKPNKIIPVPPELRRHTVARERDTLVNDIKINTGCSVDSHWEHGKISQFDIYGPGASVDIAVRQINHWISRVHAKSKESSAWAKTPAFDSNRWYYEEVEEKERDRKQVFKGPAPNTLERQAECWPESLSNQSITPRDVFGNKLERLDSLRMQDEVFITLLPAHYGIWTIEILGPNVINVEAAESHFLTIVEKICTESFGTQHSFNLILDDREGIDVVLEEAEMWWPNHNDRIVPRLLPHRMMDDPGSFRRESLHATYLSKLQNSFQLALEAVRQTKGAYDLTIRLGCLAISSKHVKDDKIGHISHKENFLKEIDGKVQLDVKKWFADGVVGAQIFRQLVSASNFLEPTRSAGYFGYVPTSLEQTRPTFRGTWVFRDPAAPPRQQHPSNTMQPPPPMCLLIVQIDWTDDEEGVYEKSAPRFYKLEQGKLGPRKNMDIYLLELGERRGWHFALESLISVHPKSVSPILIDFAERAKIKPNYDMSSTESFAEWDQTPTIKRHLQTGRLDTVYSFGIQKTCYKVEVTKMWYPQQKLPVWGLAVRHVEWATHLAELERLPIGRQADWGHTVSTFLPDDGLTSYSSGEENIDLDMGHLSLRLAEYNSNTDVPPRDGIRILTDKLMQLSAIISSVTSGGKRASI